MQQLASSTGDVTGVTAEPAPLAATPAVGPDPNALLLRAGCWLQLLHRRPQVGSLHADTEPGHHCRRRFALLQVWDRDFLKPDDFLGGLKLPVRAVMEGRGPGGTAGSLAGWFRLEGARSGEVELRVRFLVHQAGM